MPGENEEVQLEEIYAEVDKRIKAAIDALRTEILAELDKRAPAKKGFKVLRGAATGS
jgi:hypothetical protein